MGARAILDAAVSERDFQALILDWAHLNGWLCHHQEIPYRVDQYGRHRAIATPDTDPGVADLLLVHPQLQRILHREVKTQRGKLSPEQQRWGAAITAAGGDWAVWRPRDWATIEAELRWLP